MVDAFFEAAEAEPILDQYYDEYDALLKDGAGEQPFIAGDDDYYLASNGDEAAGAGTDAQVMAEETVREYADAVKDEIKSATEHVREQVEEVATSSSSAADPVPGESSFATSKMEIGKNEPGVAIAKRLAAAALNPYLLVLVTYIGAVAAELICVTRSALDHKVRKHLKQRSVQGYAILAGLNLASTWTFLIKYLFDSYANFLQVARLARNELTSVPSCTFDRSARCLAARTTAQLMRIGTWLQNTTLFEEAWLMVVVRQLNWWWSAEVCSFTVGFWALYVRIQGARYKVPHLWAYMLLGQTCAISVAASIFSMAIEARKDTSQQRADVSALSGVAFAGASTASKRRASDADMPPPTSPRRRSNKMTEATLQPSLRSKLLMLIAMLAGAACVYFKPTDINVILAMHAAPMLIASPVFVEPVSHSAASSAFENMLSTTILYAVAALVSLAIRLRLHYDVYTHGFTLNDLMNVFLSTSAQASISSDVIGITLYAFTAFVLQIAAASRSGQPKRLITLYSVLLLLTPVIGPSTTMSAVFAVEEYRVGKASMGRSSKASAGRTSTTSARSSLPSNIATPMKERLSEIFSRRPSSSPSATASSSRRKPSSSTPLRRKASTRSINESANESTAESTAVKKKPAARRKAAATNADDTTVVKKPRGRPKKIVVDVNATDASVTEGEESTASTAAAPRKRATATRGRGTATRKAATTRTRKASAKSEAEDESAASGTDADGSSTRTRRSASTTRGRGRGRPRKAAA